MYKLEISNGNYDTYVNVDNSVIAEKTVEFEMPSTDEEFDEIVKDITKEGYYYRILKPNGAIYCTGILTIDSLYDDLIIVPKYNK